MGKYAIINGTNVVNLIVAESKEIAEQLTGLVAVEVLEDDSDAEPGGTYENGIFIWGPAPFPSWTWNQTTRDYDPPTPCPSSTETAFEWNEEKLEWEPHPFP